MTRIKPRASESISVNTTSVLGRFPPPTPNYSGGAVHKLWTVVGKFVIWKKEQEQKIERKITRATTFPWFDPNSFGTHADAKLLPTAAFESWQRKKMA